MNIPLFGSSETGRFQLAGTLLSDFSSNPCFAGGCCFKSSSCRGNGTRISHSKMSARSRSSSSDEFDNILRELGLKKEIEKIREIRQLGNSRRTQKQQELRDNSASSSEKNGEIRKFGNSVRTQKQEEELRDNWDGSSSDFLEELDINGKDDNLVRIGSRGRKMMKRDNLIAKQVISIQSALTLGFVSQLWVDTNSWLVVIVEVRPNLLSGEPERCLLEDITKVGDVLLVGDEHVMENDFKLIGLETLLRLSCLVRWLFYNFGLLDVIRALPKVGYTVVTPGRRSIGKVRGYTFNINSGAVESLELDSFGISIIPSSLVSTYALLVEDVLEVLPDTIVVHEAAASRLQRLTKGFWGTRNMDDSVGVFEEEYSDDDGGRDDARSGYGRSKGRKFEKKILESSDEWELPMDFL